MDDVTLRPVVAAELAELAGLWGRADAAAGRHRSVDVEELAADLDDERVVLATDTRVAVVDGAVAGFVYTLTFAPGNGLERCYLMGAVDPAHRGRGAGRALLAWAVERARAQLGAPGVDHVVRVEAQEPDHATARLLTRLGFVAVRRTEDLLRPVEPLLPHPDLPGARVVPWPVARDEEIRAAKNAAFADHWGSTPTSPYDWDQAVHGPGARPDLSVVALDAATGQVVGHCLNHRYPADDELLGRREAWIDSLGTTRPWRGRGLATAMIAASLHAFAADGVTHAALSVDTESLTGAARLYRSLGFVPQQCAVTYEIRVP